MEGAAMSNTGDWEFVPRGEWRNIEAMAEGTAAIHRDGAAVFCTKDLASIGVSTEAAVVCQIGTMRIGIRQPRTDYERAHATRVGIVKRGKTDTGRRTISIRRPLRMLALDPRKIAPLRVELRVVNDALLILDLTAIDFGQGAQKPAAAAKGETEK
jgi:hypothetical protein